VPGSFQECVIARESGGDASAVNPASGAGGLYGFLPSTWASLGYSGLPEDASVAVQTQAFDKLYAEAGTTPWSSDGCA
jgi:soluble lytic murein transglycosylase-like protein